MGQIPPPKRLEVGPGKKSPRDAPSGMTHRAVPEPGRPGRILECTYVQRNCYLEEVATVRTLGTHPTVFEFLAGQDQDQRQDGSRWWIHPGSASDLYRIF